MAWKPAVLIVDSEQSTCDYLVEGLAEEGYDCCSATSVAEAIGRLRRRSFDLALLEVSMPGDSGMGLLATMVQSYGGTSVIMNTSVADTDTAVEAMRRGAVDYIMKPCSMEVLKARLGVALRRKCLPRRRTGTAYDDDGPDNPCFNTLDAIARGVEAKISYLDSHWKLVIEQTIQTARRMRFEERQINEWAIRRKGSLLARERGMEWAVGNFAYGEQVNFLEMEPPGSQMDTSEEAG